MDDNMKKDEMLQSDNQNSSNSDSEGSSDF